MAAATKTPPRPQRVLRSMETPTPLSTKARAHHSSFDTLASPTRSNDHLNEDRGSGTSMSASSSREDSEPLTDIDSASHSSREAEEVAEVLNATNASGIAATDDDREAHTSTSQKKTPSPARATTSTPQPSSKKLPRIVRPAYLYVDPDTNCAAPEEPTDDIAGVPVFTPTWDEFRDFYSYCERIDAWGMRSGIVKIIPPREWTQNLPRLDGRDTASSESSAGACYTLDNRLSQVRIKNSIEQIFTPAGTGVWRQSNVVHPARIVNAKQWSDTCSSEVQRGPDMARMKSAADRQRAMGNNGSADKEDGVRTRSGRGTQGSSTGSEKEKLPKVTKRKRESKDPDEGESSVQSKSAASKIKMAERTQQREWDAFNYISDWCKEAGIDAKPEDWTPEVCRAIEREYWRSLNWGKPPMYGADLAGTLFTDATQHWNVGKLDNILTRLRLRRKLPGVTTPYLYFGMWRATFAWHVEDMDLYSINYIHFGAPKQWYAIRQADKQRFELAMAGAFPADSNRCRHFMRHKSYLASPAFLGASVGKVKPLRLVQHAQEFVITYPYGYHSGYNLGYNCAESVNFALESWLDIGRKAGYCDCTHDSVKMDVDAMLEESEEMEELERKRLERERRKEDEDAMQTSEAEKLAARRIKAREARQRRKEQHTENVDKDALDEEPKAKKAKQISEQSCIFCPSTTEDDLIPIPDDEDSDTRRAGRKVPRYAHRLCASFLPETWIAPNPSFSKGGKQSKEIVMGFSGIPKARWGIKCQLCLDPVKQKRGAKVQCTYGKCSRSSHVSCALDEGSGWMLDVLDDDEADVLEARGSNAGSNGAAAANVREEDSQSPRLVILCHMHNPELRQQEARRKAEILRALARSLLPDQKVLIRAGSGIWETTLKAIEVPEGPLPEEPTKIDDETVVATLSDGSQVCVSKIVFSPEVVKKFEAEYDALEAARIDRLDADMQKAVAALQARQEARDAEKAARKAELQRKREAKEARKAALNLKTEAQEEQEQVQMEAGATKPKRVYKRKRASAKKEDEALPPAFVPSHPQGSPVVHHGPFHQMSVPYPVPTAFHPRDFVPHSGHSMPYLAPGTMHQHGRPYAPITLAHAPMGHPQPLPQGPVPHLPAPDRVAMLDHPRTLAAMPPMYPAEQRYYMTPAQRLPMPPLYRGARDQSQGQIHRPWPGMLSHPTAYPNAMRPPTHFANHAAHHDAAWTSVGRSENPAMRDQQAE